MDTEVKDEVVQIHLDDIIPNRFQPREVFDERALKELAVSIREHGVIQPIIVRNVNGKYEIIAGERRYKASALAGLTKIPAIIRNLDDKESSKVALLENLQRKNLNPVEEARTYQKILEIDEMTQEELAKTMGKSQSAVANKIRLLSLPEDIQESLLKERISERHARALLNVTDPIIQKELMEKVEATKMSVRALEEEIRSLYPKGKDASEIPVEANAMESASTGFLDNNPLTPTVSNVEEEVSNYGKVVIAPPTENEIVEENEDMSKYINYGDTDLESAAQGVQENQGLEELNPVQQPVQPQPVTNLQPISNVQPQEQPQNSALDNLLDVNHNRAVGQEQAKPQDYFELSELPSIKVPEGSIPNKEAKNMQVVDNKPINPLPTIVTSSVQKEEQPEEMPENYSMEEAVRKVRDLIEELKLHGVKIAADEMDFPQSYQVIIKIDK